MGLEIERKYLVANEGWRQIADIGQHIVQGYLCTDGTRSVRVRIYGSDAYLTVKGAGMGLVRQEFEYPIPESDASQMIDTLCGPKVISKWRYRVPYDNRLWEVDVFEGENQGLVLAEIELRTASDTFHTPDWVGTEVSEDPRYRNAHLVDQPWMEWGSGG